MLLDVGDDDDVELGVTCLEKRRGEAYDMMVMMEMGCGSLRRERSVMR